MIVLSDTAFHAAEGDPTNLKLCQRGTWEDRMLVETVLSMAAFNVLVQWHGFQPTASGFVPLSMAEFSL
jgi:hypothetical protein